MNKKDGSVLQKAKGLGFKSWSADANTPGHLSVNEKAFARYIDRLAPAPLRQRMLLCGYTSTTLYHGIVQAVVKLRDEKPKLTYEDACLISIFRFLITDADFKKHANQAHKRLLVAGVDIAAEDLKRMNGSEEYLLLHQAFPKSEYFRHLFTRLAAGRRAISRQAQRLRAKRATKDAERKRIIIEQWQKYEGDKATAASFATKISGGADDSATPEYWHDVVTGERLTAEPISRKTVAKWINAYLKGK